MTYTYTVTLRPYGDDPNAGIVQIDPVARYGYWEHRDGTEGGGLWFQPQCANPTANGAGMVAGKPIPDGPLELIDYDGDFELPARVIKALRNAGYFLDEQYF
jgi:hypothetical protein